MVSSHRLIRVAGLVVVVAAAASGAGAIGIAVSSGPLVVDHSTVTGNANLSEGSSVETRTFSGRIQLSGGSRFTLDSNSAARVFAGRVELERGSGTLATTASRLAARGFEVSGDEAQALVRVALKADGVEVSALSGSARVRNRGGMMVARVLPGTALHLTPTAADEGISEMVGRLRLDGGRYMLKDKVTNLDVELRGAQWREELGRIVEVSGRASSSADRESQVIEVARLSRLELEQEPQGSGGARPTDKPTKEAKREKEKVKSTDKTAAATAGAAAGGAAAGGAAAGGAAAGGAAAGGAAAGGAAAAGVAAGAAVGLSVGAKVAIVALAAGGAAGTGVAVAGQSSASR